MAGRAGAPDDSGRYARRGLSAVHGRERLRARAARPAASTSSISAIPNNPTGATLTKPRRWPRWVDWAREHRRRHHLRRGLRGLHPRGRGPALDLRDRGRARGRHRVPRLLEDARGSPARAARTPSCPRSCDRRHGQRASASASTRLWFRRQSTKFNGVPYVIQKGAAAVYTDEGQAQVRALVDYYMENTRIIRDGLEAAGLTVYGGRNAPYIWLRTPRGLSLLGLLRQAPERGSRGRHAGLGLRALRRGLFPADRLRLARANPGSDRAHQDSAVALALRALSNPEARRGPLRVRRPRARRRRSVCRLHTPRPACQRWE